ncbi:Uncharacterised protein [Yersinia pseudotuberculosis]|nr:hypothetical protein BZ20_1384 [Yersinia pseudotuberculosis]CND14733.1 Uncharacterised protein [Yersinia pseudotuberculosis]CND96408.1 Uncharacterised protein [Yersinia pseudotuberculosis]CNH90545.1 Uncharacterised protein [Yersinia pseudotuberculosis]CNI41054.1 Uncharacterised protein [Yersinia pseudotuberculosis]
MISLSQLARNYGFDESGILRVIPIETFKFSPKQYHL